MQSACEIIEMVKGMCYQCELSRTVRNVQSESEMNNVVSDIVWVSEMVEWVQRVSQCLFGLY